MWKCKYCGKEIDTDNQYIKSGHIANCPKWIAWKDENITKEFLYKRYIEEEASLPEIAEELKLASVSPINKQLKKFNIKTRTIKEASPNRNKKLEKTNMERYGAPHNLSNNHPIRLAYFARILAEHGVINPFQLEEVKNKTKETLLAKHGVEYISQVPEIREKALKSCIERHGASPTQLMNKSPKSRGRVFTKPHKEVYEYIKLLGYDPKLEKYISDGYRIYFGDIGFDNTNKLIEVYGDYWHANPKKYKADDLIDYPKKKVLASDVWEENNERLSGLTKLGYNVLIVWEGDLKRKKQETLDIIRKFMETNENRKNKKNTKNKISRKKI